MLWRDWLNGDLAGFIGCSLRLVGLQMGGDPG
jgi:hypothetical protein